MSSPDSSPSSGAPLYKRPWLVVAAVALLWFLLVQGVPRVADKQLHWDVSSYLRMARQEIDQMPMLARYDWAIECQKLDRGEVTDRYRKLARYGHIWILAQLYRVGGPGMPGLQTSMTAYTALLGISLVLLLLLLAEARRAIPAGESGNESIWPAALAAVLFLCGGGMVQYLNGHLVSEVPALCLLALSAWLLLKGLHATPLRHAAAFSLLAGLTLGALYIVRLESIWTNAALLVALGMACAFHPRQRVALATMTACAAVGGLAILVLWIAQVGPIGSPFYFLKYATAYTAVTPIELSRQNVLFALAPSALLFPFTLLARPWRLVLAAWSWFLLAAFPLALVYLRQGPVEARMFGVLLPPVALLLLLAFAGLERIALNRITQARAARIVAVLLPALAAVLGVSLQSDTGRDALGRWSGTGPWAVADRENQDYHFGDLVQIATLLDKAHYPALHLLRAPQFSWSAYASILSYLQYMRFDEPLGDATPFASRPNGPWFALVGAGNPVLDLQRAALAQYPELNQRQVQVQAVYEGQGLVLFQVTAGMGKAVS